MWSLKLIFLKKKFCKQDLPLLDVLICNKARVKVVKSLFIHKSTSSAVKSAYF